MGALRRRRARAHHTKMSLTRSLVAQSMLGLARAQSGGASSSGNEERAASDDSEGGDDNESSGSKGASLYVDYLQDGYAVLVRRRKKFWDPTKTKTICSQNPFILSHDGPTTNGNCLDGINKANRSCTCITGVTKNNPEWTFTVTKKKRKSNAVMPLTASNPIAITGIAPMFTGSVSTLKIIGVGPDPEKIPFLDGVDNDGTPVDPTLEFAKSSEKALTKVVIQNVDLNDALSNPDFFSPWLTNLTLRNCNIQDGKTGFLKKLGSLQYLNMANNNLTVLPQEIMYAFELKYVYLNGNPITNLTVSEKLYLSVNGLDAFEVGSATATNCTSQSSRQSHGVKFCVPVSTGAAGGNSTVAPSASDSSGSNKFLLIGVIGGCVIVVVLLFFVVRKRSSSQNKENAFVKHTNSVFEDTLSFDHSSQHASVSSTLLNDPIIITHRIPYNDIKIATCISRGGFGLVYSGTFNRRRVAVKKIRSDINADIKQIEMFLKEICLMASLNHPRIVEFIGVSWDSLRNLCAVTEFMERGDLRDVLQSARARNARLSWDSHKSQIAMHVAEALTYLHSLSPKVIHRDLKSKNILLDNEMTAKLSDFGVSRERRIEETHMTAGIGTAFWIAPEVLLGMDYDERADIFSFGIVLSEIDTEDYPYWNEKNPASGGKQQENVILRMVATGALRPEFSDACPQAILDLAAACLDVNPDRRPTAAQVVYTLHQLIRSSPLTPASGITPL